MHRRYKEDQGSKKIGLGGHRTILSHSIEEELNMHIIDMETRFFGLTTKDLWRLVFEIAEKNNIKHNFNKCFRMAGKKWLTGYLQHNTKISLRTPENASFTREQASLANSRSFRLKI